MVSPGLVFDRYGGALLSMARAMVSDENMAVAVVSCGLTNWFSLPGPDGDATVTDVAERVGVARAVFAAGASVAPEMDPTSHPWWRYSAPERAAFALCVGWHRSYREAAEVVGLSPAAVADSLRAMLRTHAASGAEGVPPA